MFAYGRNLYSLSRAGYYPAFLSLTGKKKTPYWGLVVGAIIGFAALFIIAYGGDGAGSVVLNIAVWGGGAGISAADGFLCDPQEEDA